MTILERRPYSRPTISEIVLRSEPSLPKRWAVRRRSRYVNSPRSPSGSMRVSSAMATTGILARGGVRSSLGHRDLSQQGLAGGLGWRGELLESSGDATAVAKGV